MKGSEDYNSYRPLKPGMGQAVAERTVLRKKENGEWETWKDVADRVALGNSLLLDGPIHTQESEYQLLRKHIAKGNTLMSGRHLQHGDATQPTRNMEVYTNCSTASTSFLLFYLLLNGSGVGRSYDDDMMLVDWDHAPNLRVVIDSSHPDYDYTAHESLRDAQHKYGTGKNVLWFEVPDSREGWAKALELWENAAFEKIHSHKLLILDFSKVRERGKPIGGMQSRPASGPVPLMNAFLKAAALKGAGIAPWKQTMYVDHYFAECVLVGGARRAARMSTKHWSDKNVLDFITVKRPIEYKDMSAEDIIRSREENPFPPMGFLWSSNNSVTVDDEFWEYVKSTTPVREQSDTEKHAKKVFRMVCEAAYADGTGEPGFINSHKLVQKDDGWTDLNRGDYVESNKLKINEDTQILMSRLAKRAKKKKYHYIVNPCVPGDTPILTRTGYQNIGDVIGQEVDVWNGEEWSTVTPFATGLNPIVEVNLSDGSRLQCTPYHKFFLSNGSIKTAEELVEGDALIKASMPVVTTGVDYDVDAYSQGFYSGDGSTDLHYSLLYEEKYACSSRLIGCFGEPHASSDRKMWTHGAMLSKDFVPVDGNIEYCLNWLGGLIDSDGTVTRDKNGNGIQITSVDRNFLDSVRLMLTRLGTSPKVVKGHPERDKEIKGIVYHCQETFRLLIGNQDTYNLLKLGLKTERVSLHTNPPQRDARRFVKVISVVDMGMSIPTFCFTEPKKHAGVFNGILTGNCGEIVLNMLGAFCVISDLVPFHCDSLDEAEECTRVVTRALMRVNLMDSIYSKEVKRTNRIGVGMTGVHEFAWKFFKVGFRDLIADFDLLMKSDITYEELASKAKSPNAVNFWLALARLNRAVADEAKKYAKELGVKVPHTMTTIKPAGTTSKLYGLTEGWHLPAMSYYLRWVQFRTDDPLVKQYWNNGYPIRELKSYSGTTIVGFPTAPAITELNMGNALVTAGEATPEEQFKWLMLGEKFWIHGTDENGVPLEESYGNQISYTLKYVPKLVDLKHFQEMVLKYQSSVRCCSVMPQIDTSSYEYQPEQPITREEYNRIENDIIESMWRSNQSRNTLQEEIGREHVNCDSGACPVDFNSGSK